MERTAELTPAESETLLRGHVWQQPENENLVCGAISSVIGARENQQDRILAFSPRGKCGQGDGGSRIARSGFQEDSALHSTFEQASTYIKAVLFITDDERYPDIRKRGNPAHSIFEKCPVTSQINELLRVHITRKRPEACSTATTKYNRMKHINIL